MFFFGAYFIFLIFGYTNLLFFYYHSFHIFTKLESTTVDMYLVFDDKY